MGPLIGPTFLNSALSSAGVSSASGAFGGGAGGGWEFHVAGLGRISGTSGVPFQLDIRVEDHGSITTSRKSEWTALP